MQNVLERFSDDLFENIKIQTTNNWNTKFEYSMRIKRKWRNLTELGRSQLYETRVLLTINSFLY